MATGATDVFDESRDQICAEALENVGAIGPGDTRTANNSLLFDVAARALNRVVKAIDKDGQFLWRFVRRTTTTTAATASFTLGTDVLDIDEPMRYTRSGFTSASPIRPMSRDEYMRLGDRTTPGVPSRFYIESTLTTKTVYLWGVPDATGDTIEYVAVLRAKDYVSGANTSDFTQKWQSALVYGTTMELAPKFAQADQVAMWNGRFNAEKLQLENDDTERGNVVLVPFGYGYRSGAG